MRKLTCCKKTKCFSQKLTIICLFVLLISIALSPRKLVAQSTETNRQDFYIHAARKADSSHSMDIISDLCSEEFTGRQSGTEGCEKSAAYISSTMEQIGLVPSSIDSQGSYFQSFPVPYIQINSNTVCKYITDETYTFPYKNEFYPYIKSDSGAIKTEAVFVGYGIEMGTYDDYEGVDVENKIVVILRDNPSFLNLAVGSKATFDHKIYVAKKHKASGILILDLPNHKNPLQFHRKTVYDPGETKGILSGFLTSAGAVTLLNQQDESIDEIIDQIQTTKQPYSFQFDGSIELAIDISREERQTKNVIGYIPSESPSDKSILITAHYDHLGQDSISKDYFFGANDNASGVSIVLECARVFKSLLTYSDYNILFVAFSGEEEGLIGSKWYTKHPLFPLEDIQAVFNLDMVGTGDSPLIAGTDPSVYEDLGDAIELASDSLDIPIEFTPRGLTGGSDQYYFHLENVPSVFFWRSGTNVWETYHTPADTINMIIEENIKETVQMCLFSILELIQPHYIYFPVTPPLNNNHPRILLEGLGSENVSVYINNQLYDSNYKGLLKTIYSVKNGAEEITFSTKNSKGLILGTQIYTIQSHPITELIADLDYNYRVDIEDLILFSRVYPSSSLFNWLAELADMNSDNIVDEKDFTLLSNYFGYQFEP